MFDFGFIMHIILLPVRNCYVTITRIYIYNPLDISFYTLTHTHTRTYYHTNTHTHTHTFLLNELKISFPDV